MALITCPCCAGRGEIEEKAPVPLHPLEFRIWDVVRRSPGGISGRALTERVYADRADGGPDCADNVVRVTIVRVNRKLAPAGLRIACNKNGRSFGYKLQRLA